MPVGSLGVTSAALGALARRPDLWPAAVGTAWRMAVPGWWRRWPPRPVPDEAYRRFRAQTMFGGDGSRLLGPEELLDFLSWCSEQRRGTGARIRRKATILRGRRG